MVVAAALARTMVGRPRPSNPLAWALALASGADLGHERRRRPLHAWLDWSSRPPRSAWGWRQRRGQGALWLAVGAAAVPLLVGASAFGWDFD